MRLVCGSLIVLLAACGGGDNDNGGGSASAELKATATEFSFSPDAWLVAADAELTLTYDNVGTIEHNFLVLTSPIEQENQLTEDLVLFQTTAGVGDSVTETIPPLPEGTYQVICDIEGHFAAGMEGLLTVGG